jgi:hypothetical protein
MQSSSTRILVALLMAAAVAIGGTGTMGAQTANTAAAPVVPHYDHIFLMVLENHGLN